MKIGDKGFLVKDDIGHYNFIYKVIDIDDYRLELEVWGKREWEPDDKEDRIEYYKDIESEENYLRCEIRWDGCSHFYFNKYLHICGQGSFINHIKLINELWGLAQENISNFEGD